VDIGVTVAFVSGKQLGLFHMSADVGGNEVVRTASPVSTGKRVSGPHPVTSPNRRLDDRAEFSSTVATIEPSLDLRERGPVSPPESGERDEPEPLIERDQVGVADDVDHVEAGERGEDPADQLGPDALSAPLPADLEERDVGGEDHIADRGDETNRPQTPPEVESDFEQQIAGSGAAAPWYLAQLGT
jgi:hypothetical protein